MHMNLFSL